MKLYIDTSTYTSYISLTSEVKSLEKLKRLITENKVDLILPSQTKQEYAKHLKQRVEQAKKKLEEPATQFSLPNELKGKKKDIYTKEEKEIAEKVDSLNADLKKLLAKRDIELKKHLSNVEKLIKEIFDLATEVEDNDEIVLKAILRHVKGLPPKKDNMKFGDAIIWETIKDYVRTEEISIVSYDHDFSEPEKKGKPAKINNTLKTEWKKHTKKGITLYSLLGQFVNTIEKENPISSETIKKEAAQATGFIGGQFASTMMKIHEPTYLVSNQLGLGSIDTAGRLTIPVGGGASILGSEPNTLLCYADNTAIAGLGNHAIYTGAADINRVTLADSGALTRHVFTADTLTAMTNICTRCHKRYSISATAVNFSNLCNDCSKYFSL